MISVKELTDYGITQGEEDGTMVMKALGFKGEMLFTSTLMNLIDQRPSVVYFTQGHGEHDLNSEALDGYLSLRQSLEGRNLQVRSLLLHQEGTIPDDAAAVVIAGGNQPWRAAKTSVCFRPTSHEEDACWLPFISNLLGC